MDFCLSKEQQSAQKLFREFAENEVKPIAREVDETEEFPIETVRKMAERGMMGISVPIRYGGQGADVLTYVLCVEELSKVCATTGVIVSAHTSLCIDPILRYGTEAQKMKYVPELATGRKIGAFALTESGAGTDAQGQQTCAMRQGDNYILNGSKIFITNAGYADVFIVFAITGVVADANGSARKEITAFLVERGFQGFSVGKPEQKMGIRGSSTCELIFEDCIVPKENMLGIQGRGFQIAMNTLDGGRIGVAAQALGIAEGAIEETIRYTKERVQFGRSIAQFQNTQFQLADMATKAKAAQYLVYAAASKKEAVQNGLQARYSEEAAMAKLFASEAASDITSRCVQLFGGYGYTRDYPIERMMRDAKITEIYEGTSEVQRMVIAAALGVAEQTRDNIKCKAEANAETEMNEIAEVANKLLAFVGDEIVVAVGRGIGKDVETGIALAQELAEVLGGGFVGASRAVTDAGWMTAAHMIGQTGKSVHPRVYVALGISGAAQHRLGVEGVECIVAVNKNATAPIFQMADYSIQGDLFQVVPELIQAIKSNQ